MLIISAGMNRSASTWLYNVIRLLIQESASYSNNFRVGWVDDVLEYVDYESVLLKVHQYDDELAKKADFIFYSYRDLRDVLASLKRKFNNNPTLERANLLVETDRLWRNQACYNMRYEDFLHSELEEIKCIASALDISDVEPKLILKKLELLSYDSKGSRNDLYHNDNLFHQGHITDGRIGSWDGELDIEFVKELVDKHKYWFESNSYSV